MRKIRHVKIKNTGILFELLAKQVAIDALKNKDSKAVSIIKEHFSNTELGKELELYRYLLEENFSNSTSANTLIEEVLRLKKRLDTKKLKRQKYNLVKDIKEAYGLESFFKTKIDKYKLLASIYKIFEHDDDSNPSDFIKSKHMVMEHLIRKQYNPSAESKNLILEQEKDMRPFIIKVMTDKFNKKYSSLSERQKKLLREFVNNISNRDKFREYYDKEIKEVINELKQINKTVEDKSLKIKINEICNIQESTSKNRTQKDVLKLLRYYELADELK